MATNATVSPTAATTNLQQPTAAGSGQSHQSAALCQQCGLLSIGFSCVCGSTPSSPHGMQREYGQCVWQAEGKGRDEGADHQAALWLDGLTGKHG